MTAAAHLTLWKAGDGARELPVPNEIIVLPHFQSSVSAFIVERKGHWSDLRRKVSITATAEVSRWALEFSQCYAAFSLPALDQIPVLASFYKYKIFATVKI